MTEETTIPATVGSFPGPVWPALIALTAATFWTVTGEMLPSALLPSMSQDLGVSEALIGTLVSAWAITIALAGIPLVRLTLRVPRTLLLVLALAATAPTNLITALADDFVIALTGRILTATAHGLFWAVVVSYVAAVVEPARLGRALSIVLSGPAIAGLLGLPAAAFLADVVGWRAVFAGLSIVLALTTIVLWRILPRRLDADGDPGEPPPAAAWDRSAPGVIGVALGGGLVLAGHFAAFTYVTTLVTGLGGLDAAAIPAVLLVLGITGALGIAVSGIASDRFPRAAVALAATLIALGLALLRIGEGNPAVFVTGTALWGFAVGAFPPILQAHVLRASSANFRPLAGSVVVTVLNLGIAAGAALGGITLVRGESTLALAALAAAALGSIALVVHRPASPVDL